MPGSCIEPFGTHGASTYRPPSRFRSAGPRFPDGGRSWQERVASEGIAEEALGQGPKVLADLGGIRNPGEDCVARVHSGLGLGVPDEPQRRAAGE